MRRLLGVIVLLLLVTQGDAATLLFRSGFEPGVTLEPPANCDGTNNCYQDFSGTDAVSGFTWPIQALGSQNTQGGGNYLQAYQDSPALTVTNVCGFFETHLAQTVGYTGATTTALFQRLQGSEYQGATGRQQSFNLTPDTTVAESDFYMSFWLKFQPDLATQLITGQFPDESWGNWRIFADWKTGGPVGGGIGSGCMPGRLGYQGDFRITIQVNHSDTNGLFWRTEADTMADGGLAYERYWRIDTTTVPVPIDTWFHVETFLHRSSGAGGRVWAAINGSVIVDRLGANMGVNSCKLNRIMAPILYTGGYQPAYQWIDDLEIWDGFPD
jgi:hypothetical protein